MIYLRMSIHTLRFLGSFKVFSITYPLSRTSLGMTKSVYVRCLLFSRICPQSYKQFMFLFYYVNSLFEAYFIRLMNGPRNIC